MKEGQQRNFPNKYPRYKKNHLYSSMDFLIAGRIPEDVRLSDLGFEE